MSIRGDRNPRNDRCEDRSRVSLRLLDRLDRVANVRSSGVDGLVKHAEEGNLPLSLDILDLHPALSRAVRSMTVKQTCS